MATKIVLETSFGDGKYYTISVNGLLVCRVRKDFYEKRLEAVIKTCEALGQSYEVEFRDRRSKLDKSKTDEILKSVEEIGKAATGRKYGVTKQAIQNFCKLMSANTQTL